MNRDDIIRMALEAGLTNPLWIEKDYATIEYFAQLVAAAATEAANARANASWTLMCEKMIEVEIHEAVLEEREACAQIAFSWNTPTTDQVAKEIRERGQK